VYDWDRVDSNGKPRELHTDQAADVLRYEAQTVPDERHIVFDTAEVVQEHLIQCAYFTIDKWELSAPHAVPLGKKGSQTCSYVPREKAFSHTTEVTHCPYHKVTRCSYRPIWTFTKSNHTVRSRYSGPITNDVFGIKYRINGRVGDGNVDVDAGYSMTEVPRNGPLTRVASVLLRHVGLAVFGCKQFAQHESNSPDDRGLVTQFSRHDRRRPGGSVQGSRCHCIF